MKKLSIFILVFSVLIIVFLSSFIGLSISKDYAHNHYRVNGEIGELKKFGITIKVHYWGCGEDDCKYCNGDVTSGSVPYKSEYAEDFVYYRTINGFSIASLVCMIISAVGLTSTLLLKYREPIKRALKKN